MSDFTYQEDDLHEEGRADELFTIPVKAGRRIYYLDVKATRNNDYYITITESRKRQMRDGSFVIDRHKIHLYKEDFNKFADALQEVIAYIRENRPEEHNNENIDVVSNTIEQSIPTEEEFFKDI